MKAALETLRPRQWVKNIVIFAGLIFDGQLFLKTPFLRVFLAFIIFCLVSGLTYTINDLLDIKADQLHPRKRFRPIASGRLSKSAAIILVILLSLIAGIGAYMLSPWFALICLTYTLVMLAYSKWLKQILILDVMIIALGFVLRVVAGLLMIKVKYFSPWLFVLTTFLALFLGFGKRYGELKLLEQDASKHRKVLAGYSIPLLTQYLNVILSGIVITYSMYTFGAHPGSSNHFMMLTIPFVIYGVFRYMYLIQNSSATSAPEDVLFKDRPLEITIILWISAAVLIQYFCN